MSYSDYGGFAWKNGVRYTEARWCEIHGRPLMVSLTKVGFTRIGI